MQIPGGQDIIDRVKQHHAYDAWRDANTLPENLFIWHFFLRGDEFATWECDSVQRIAAPDLPPLLQSVWKRSDPGEGAMLLVDTYECASRIAAHEFLLRLLTQFQSPHITRRQEVAVGDVAFGASEERVYVQDNLLLFARANLVNMIRKGSRSPVSVNELARQLDDHLIAKPEVPQPRAAAAMAPEEAAEVRVGEAVPLEISLPEPPKAPEAAAHAVGPRPPGYGPAARLYKCFSAGGEVLQEEGHLAYRPSVQGPQTVTVFGIDSAGTTARQELTFVAT